MPQWIQHQDRQILRLNVDGMTTEQYIQDIHDARDMVVASRPEADSVLLLVTGKQPKGSLDPAKEAWKSFQDAARDFVKAQAVSGLPPFARVVAGFVQRDLYFASSEDDALRWLMKQ